jgi:hypothetical protein
MKPGRNRGSSESVRDRYWYQDLGTVEFTKLVTFASSTLLLCVSRQIKHKINRDPEKSLDLLKIPRGISNEEFKGPSYPNNAVQGMRKSHHDTGTTRLPTAANCCLLREAIDTRLPSFLTAFNTSYLQPLMMLLLLKGSLILESSCAWPYLPLSMVLLALDLSIRSQDVRRKLSSNFVHH